MARPKTPLALPTVGFVVIVAGCGLEDADETGSPDDDDDGWTVAEGDCDDHDPAVNPGLVEACRLIPTARS